MLPSPQAWQLRRRFLITLFECPGGGGDVMTEPPGASDDPNDFSIAKMFENQRLCTTTSYALTTRILV
ncbi:MAG TPA: hypothetical protein PLO06_11570, partial [Methanoregulaceae archaeon]|nr:hypothetical protein [Methanoregulaceae archaeon]